MSENYRKRRDALIVAGLVVLLCVLGEQCGPVAARRPAAAAGGGTGYFESEPSAEGTEVLSAEGTEVLSAGGTEEPESELPAEEPEEDFVPLPDLTDEFALILKGATKEFIGGYPVDDSFLMWLDAQYGDEVICELARYVEAGGTEPVRWRELTGSTMHALWMNYCRDTGYQSGLLSRVHWTGGDDGGAVILGFAGDTGGDTWRGLAEALAEEEAPTREAAGRSEGEPPTKEAVGGSEEEAPTVPGITEELLAELCAADALLVNREFADSAEGEAEGFAAGVTGAWTDVRAGEPGEAGDGTGIWYYVSKGRKLAVVSVSLLDPAAQGTGGYERLAGLISGAKAQSDYAIVLVRWGTEGNLYPDAAQTDAARAFAEAGADAVIGGHAHRLQGVGYISGVPVAYSLGNLRFSDGLLYTAFVQVVIGEEGGLQMRYIPCIQEEGGTRLLAGEEERAACYRYVMALSSGVGADADGTVYDRRRGGIPSGVIAYDSDTSRTGICGMGDVNGIPVDPAGNYKRRDP